MRHEAPRAPACGQTRSGGAGALAAVLRGEQTAERSGLPATYNEDGTVVVVKLRDQVLGQAGARGGARRRSGSSTASARGAANGSGAGTTRSGAGDDEDQGEEVDEDEGEEAGDDDAEQKKEQGVKVSCVAG